MSKFFTVKDRYGNNPRLIELSDWEKLPYDRQLDALDGLARGDYRRALEILGLTDVSLKIERKRQAGRRARNLKILEAMFSEKDEAFIETAQEALDAGGVAPKSRVYVDQMIAEAKKWPKPAPTPTEEAPTPTEEAPTPTEEAPTPTEEAS